MPGKHNPCEGIPEALNCLLVALVRGALVEIGPVGKGPQAAPAAFDRKDAAEYIAVGTTTLDELRKAGQIKPVKIGGRLVYRKTTLDRYLKGLPEED
jgi:hypothetical protein